jgi:hypothetical protein
VYPIDFQFLTLTLTMSLPTCMAPPVVTWPFANSNIKLKFLNSRGHFYFNLSSKENVGGIIAASTIINPSPHQIHTTAVSHY